MSKKSFKNPALAFISQSEEATQEPKTTIKEQQDIIKETSISKEISNDNSKDIQDKTDNSLNDKTDKSLNDKTDKSLNDKTDETDKVNKIDKTPKGYKVNPIYVETKSKRVQCLLQPSVVEKLKDKANKKGISMNEAINEAVHMYMNA